MRKNRILIVDDDEALLELLDARFSLAGYEVYKAQNGEDIFDRVSKTIPDVILLDILMPGLDGLEVKAKLNGNAATADIPVIFLTAKDSVDDKVRGLNLGADDYITKPFDTKELMARIEAALRKKGHYEELSMTDGLTGLYNMNFFKKEFVLFFNIAKRYNKTFSLAIIDIDNFKRINDTYGHLTGDFILKTFASIAKAFLRKSDIIARYGGDEFAVLMPETGEDRARIAIERLKVSIKGKTFFSNEISLDMEFSFSAGIASYDNTFADETQMFELADKRLYEDKMSNHHALPEQ